VSSEEEQKEITVSAPSKSAVSAERQSERSLEKALEEERFEVLQFPKKVSRYLGLTAMLVGFFLVLLFAYVGLTGQMETLFLSGTVFPSLVLWGFVGLLNVVVGFLFLGRE
jgi:hypothetical protein